MAVAEIHQDQIQEVSDVQSQIHDVDESVSLDDEITISPTVSEPVLHESLILFFIIGFLLQYYVALFSLIGSMINSIALAFVIRLMILHIYGAKFSSFEIPVVDDVDDLIIPLESIDFFLRTKKADFTIIYSDDEAVVRVVE